MTHPLILSKELKEINLSMGFLRRTNNGTVGTDLQKPQPTVMIVKTYSMKIISPAAVKTNNYSWRIRTLFTQ